ncbi:hypothetical protein E2C01_016974 [Portunus trituberculatus]|uniref:Uncharacterized protein n=1 Tax=Portunus trituberculatus TaxID=210409 RepID=A0A5B7DR67_PORTR|nr:hypothetical protein [Portunus trituberculatus]
MDSPTPPPVPLTHPLTHPCRTCPPPSHLSVLLSASQRSRDVRDLSMRMKGPQVSSSLSGSEKLM